MENTTYPISIVEIKKQLLKTKQMAKLLHYSGGKLWYTIELEVNGNVTTWKFPIHTVVNKTEYFLPEYEGDDEIEFNYFDLSEDLGDTPFESEVRASELNRWIAFAYDNQELGQL